MLRFYGFLIWAKKCARYGGFFIPYFWEKSILHTRAHTSYVLILTHIQLQPVGINGYRWYKKNSYRQKGIVKNNVPEKTAPTHTQHRDTSTLSKCPFYPDCFSLPLNLIFSGSQSTLERHQNVWETSNHNTLTTSEAVRSCFFRLWFGIMLCSDSLNFYASNFHTTCRIYFIDWIFLFCETKKQWKFTKYMRLQILQIYNRTKATWAYTHKDNCTNTGMIKNCNTGIVEMTIEQSEHNWSFFHNFQKIEWFSSSCNGSKVPLCKM